MNPRELARMHQREDWVAALFIATIYAMGLFTGWAVFR